MKTQTTQPMSVKRSLAAMMLMAASSMVPAGALDLSGTVATAIRTDADFLQAGLPIPASEVRHGAILQMTIATDGAFSLRLAFPNFSYRKTGVFTEHESSTPEEPFYVANIGGPTGPGRIYAERYADGQVGLWWVVSAENPEEGDSLLGGYALSPTIRRDGNPDYTPAIYNTVHFRPDPIREGDDSSPDDVKVGTGYGSLRISASGAAMFAGVLPDGKGVVGSGPLVNALSVPILLRAAGGRDSLVCNMPTMDSIEETSQWSKAAAPRDPILPSGGLLGAWVTTSPYTRPAPGELPIAGAPDQPLNMVLALSAADRPGVGGSSSAPLDFLSVPFQLTAHPRAFFPAPNDEKLKVNFSPATGFFTGSVQMSSRPPRRPQTVQFTGMVKQHANSSGEAEGFYLADPLPGNVDSPKVSGLVRIVPNVVSPE